LSSADTPTAEADAEVPAVDELRDDVVARLADALGEGLVASHVDPGRDVWARVATDAWEHAGHTLRDVLGARYFCFLSVIDWQPSPFGRYLDAEVDTVLAGEAPPAPGPTEPGVTGGDSRFQVIARVTNTTDHWGVTVKADATPDDDPRIATWTRVYAGADWHEREAWEMFGITFEGHPFLRHIYLPTDFDGHPLRKDFPLIARMVKPWPGIVDVEPLPDVDEPDEPDASPSGDDTSDREGEAP
jgi:NADH-quinone oxidoreductase subunit C